VQRLSTSAIIWNTGLERQIISDACEITIHQSTAVSLAQLGRTASLATAACTVHTTSSWLPPTLLTSAAHRIAINSVGQDNAFLNAVYSCENPQYLCLVKPWLHVQFIACNFAAIVAGVLK